MKNLKSFLEYFTEKFFFLILLGLFLTFSSYDTLKIGMESKDVKLINGISLLGYTDSRVGFDGFIYPGCCLCVTGENCPCPSTNCGIFDKKIYKLSDVTTKYKVNVSEKGREQLTMYKFKNVSSSIIKEDKTYQWIGGLHNVLVLRSLDKLEPIIENWKKLERRPKKAEVDKAVIGVLTKSYKELGLSDEDFNVLMKATIAVINTSEESLKKNIKKYENLSIALESSSVNESKTAYKESIIDQEERKLNSNFNDKAMQQFIESKIGFSVIRASNNLWTTQFMKELHGKYSSQGTISVANIKEDAKDVVNSDVAGGVRGAITVGVVSAAGGPAATLGGVAIGGLGGAAGGSVVEVVTKILDWLW